MIVENISMGSESRVDDGAVVGYSPSRLIDDTSLVIGPGCYIRYGTVIYGGSVIGKGLETGHGAVIREENRIGDDFSIWNNSTVDYGCVIGHQVKIHCNVYVAQFTIIEDDVFIAPGVSIANDLHPLCSRCMKGPTLRRSVRIGAGAVILPRVEIGEGSLVGSGAVVTRDVPPGSVVVGNPARVIKKTCDIKCSAGLGIIPYPKPEV